jgi:Carboxylesterase family
MLYNHGGGYMIGPGSATGQDGTNLARLYDVVMVESNHRLGLLGYLFLGDLAGGDYAANQGMLDTLAALRWTSENIENFGGDPDNNHGLGRERRRRQDRGRLHHAGCRAAVPQGLDRERRAASLPFPRRRHREGRAHAGALGTDQCGHRQAA